MIECPECFEDVADDTRTCPVCAAELMATAARKDLDTVAASGSPAIDQVLESTVDGHETISAIQSTPDTVATVEETFSVAILGALEAASEPLAAFALANVTGLSYGDTAASLESLAADGRAQMLDRSTSDGPSELWRLPVVDDIHSTDIVRESRVDAPHRDIEELIAGLGIPIDDSPVVIPPHAVEMINYVRAEIDKGIGAPRPIVCWFCKASLAPWMVEHHLLTCRDNPNRVNDSARVLDAIDRLQGATS